MMKRPCDDEVFDTSRLISHVLSMRVLHEEYLFERFLSLVLIPQLKKDVLWKRKQKNIECWLMAVRKPEEKRADQPTAVGLF